MNISAALNRKGLLHGKSFSKEKRSQSKVAAKQTTGLTGSLLFKKAKDRVKALENQVESRMQFHDSGKSDLPYLKNPNPEQLLAFAEKHNRQLRGLIHGNDCYWWPALAQIHGNFAKQLGIDDNSYLENRLMATKAGEDLYVDWDINELAPVLKKLTKSSRILFKDGSLWVSGLRSSR